MSLTISGVDYAWDKPSAGDLKRAGHKFAMRYLSHDPSKDLTADELRQLWANDIKVGLVWESTANRALSGADGGKQDAMAAKGRAAALGLSGIPIYFAVDWDVTPAQKPLVARYLSGACSVLGKERVGVYGGYHVVKYLADRNVCRWFWQTYAWSGGLVHPKAHIYQHRNGVKVGGGTVDLNRATSEKGGFGVRGPHAKPSSGPSVAARRRWRENVRVLNRILNAHAHWPAPVRYAIRWVRDRYVKALKKGKK